MAKFRALKDLSLRAKPDPLCDEWLHWKEGDVFEPPAHMNVKRALASGKIEELTTPPTMAEKQAAAIVAATTTDEGDEAR